jgi:hypothetical protein
MALMFGSLYDALIEGGTSAEKAQKAAEEAASHEGRMAEVEARLRLVQWMLGINVGLTVAVLVLQLLPMTTSA